MRGKTSSSVVRARQLRRAQTKAEGLLWRHLRSRQLGGVKFRRQQPIGPYIVDFCSLEPKLVLEIDGSHHGERLVQDHRRTEFLERSGYRVIRFWNTDVLHQIEAVTESRS
jgi:very-short-patch-repair endonuclease